MATSSSTIMVDVNAAGEHISRLKDVKGFLADARTAISPKNISSSGTSGKASDAMYNAARAVYNKIQRDLEPAIERVIEQITRAVEEYQREDSSLAGKAGGQSDKRW